MLIVAPRSGSPFERSIEINVAGSHLLDSMVAYTYTLAPNGQRNSVTESQGRAKEALGSHLKLTFASEIKLEHTGGAFYKIRWRCRKSPGTRALSNVEM